MKNNVKKPSDIKRTTKIFKALSNENRLELFLEILKINEKLFETEDTKCFITDIMGTLSIGAPKVSHHMKELTNAGLVITERKGKFLTAKINDELIKEVAEIFSAEKS